MECPSCGKNINQVSKFCPFCGKEIRNQNPGINMHGFAVDNSGGGKTEFNFFDQNKSANPGDYCPICGKYIARDKTFRCMNCGQENLCLEHRDPVTYWCGICMASKNSDLDNSLFQVNYRFVHPFLPRKSDSLFQVFVNFSSYDDLDFSRISKVTNHLFLILDVSGSMNRPDKYPLLRDAIPELVKALSEDDLLTIILFSQGHDFVVTESILNVKLKMEKILKRIDESGILFGRRTLLAPALRSVINEVEHIRKKQYNSAERIYILTDGELHDRDECILLNPKLTSLEAEIHSYGFGQDFSLETLRQIMQGIPGGTIKPIINTLDVKKTFGHIGDLAERIIAHDAVLTYQYAPDVIPGDVFRYKPGYHLYGETNRKGKEFSVKLGSLERDRIYSFMFEGRVMRSELERQYVGTVNLKYKKNGQPKIEELKIMVDRSDDEWRNEQIDGDSFMASLILEGERSNDKVDFLKALRARLLLYQKESNIKMASFINFIIQKVESGGTIDEEEWRLLDADDVTNVF